MRLIDRAFRTMDCLRVQRLHWQGPSSRAGENLLDQVLQRYATAIGCLPISWPSGLACVLVVVRKNRLISSCLISSSNNLAIHRPGRRECELRHIRALPAVI